MLSVKRVVQEMHSRLQVSFTASSFLAEVPRHSADITSAVSTL